MWYDVHIESILNITGSSRILATMGITEKNNFLREFSRYLHKTERHNFYSLQSGNWTFLDSALSRKLIFFFFFGNKVGRVFVPKFFHDKRAYVGEFRPDNVRCEYPEVERKYYKYKKSTSGSSVKSFLVTDSDWSFPYSYYKSIGSTAKGFVFFTQTYLIH